MVVFGYATEQRRLGFPRTWLRMPVATRISEGSTVEKERKENGKERKRERKERGKEEEKRRKRERKNRGARSLYGLTRPAPQRRSWSSELFETCSIRGRIRKGMRENVRERMGESIRQSMREIIRENPSVPNL